MLSPHVQSIPIFMAHGASDPVVPIKMGEASAEYLTSVLGISKAPESADIGKGLAFRKYPGMGHSADPQELMDLNAWIASVIP